MSNSFPVDHVIADVIHALELHGGAIVEAPPGAGKSTRVPLAVLRQMSPSAGRVLMLEPRRMAARSVATFMAHQWGEPVGKTVGYRTRLDSAVSAATRLEVVTEGVLTRMLLDDPSLDGVALVIFDEFHERSLVADLGLALLQEVRAALRDDLGLLIMSATLDGARLTELLALPVIRSEGRSYPVNIEYSPVIAGRDWLDHCAEQILAIVGQAGLILVFLPGQRAIRQLRQRLETGCDPQRLVDLHGGLAPAQQQQILARASNGERLVVLSTNVAETSLTIEGVTHVVDSGWAREPVYDPARHRSRLVTRRISDASARQRAGRAGRLGSGHCLRLWASSEVLAAYRAPEIQRVALDSLVLDLARWGCRDPAQLDWLDAPPQPARDSAVARLGRFGALDEQGAISDFGKQLSAIGSEPALAMLVLAGRQQGLARSAARLAALLADRDPLPGVGADATRRLAAIAQQPGAYRPLLQEARRLTGDSVDKTSWRDAMGTLLARVYPLQIAAQRPQQPGRYRMADGPGLQLPAQDSLYGSPWLLILDTDGQPRDARIRLAWPLQQQEVMTAAEQHGHWQDNCQWDRDREKVIARRDFCLGGLVLESRAVPAPSPQQLTAGLIAGIRQLGLSVLPWTAASRQWRDRARMMAQLSPDPWPAMDDASLLDQLEQWAGPYLAGMRSLRDLRQMPLEAALQGRLSHEQQQYLARHLPTQVAVPSGRRVALDYSGKVPVLAVKLQELFGLEALPVLAEGRVTIQAQLLTPAGRPAAITDNLARFWRQSYADVRKDLRGRYPKHPWPEDPLQAQATAATKKRQGGPQNPG
ncbi:MAG: ATP-dependent helicase HrpB [Alcanivorax sp.]|nr:ATP-dependent helicase HrpB [Alcanivorax sp.]